MQIDKNRLASAYLLIFNNKDNAEDEVQKIVKMLQCEQELLGNEFEYCGDCLACKQIDAKVHSDVRYIYPDGMSIKIEQVIEVCGDSYIKPYMGKRKVFVFFDADKMTTEAGNAFLKTLEEPPGSSVFLLVTSNVSAILSTIQSRCQKILIDNGNNVQKIDDLEKDKIIKLIEESTLDDMITLFTNANKFKRMEREQVFNLLEIANEWYMEKRNFNMVELIEKTKKAIKQNANIELAMDVLLLNRKL